MTQPVVVIEEPVRPTVIIEVTAPPVVKANPVGLPGLSAYEIAVRNGFVGSEAQWLASLNGAAANSLIYERSVAAAQWSITHAFPRPPSVQLLINGAVSYADIDHPDSTHVLITFAAPMAGLAILT